MIKVILSLLLMFAPIHAGGFELNEQVNFLFFGAFAMIIVYNIGYFVFTKSSTYSTYFSFHVTLFIVMLFYTGMFEESWVDFTVYGVPVGFFFLATAMLFAFTRDFFDLRTLYPKIGKYFDKLIIVNLAFLFLSAFSISNNILEAFAIGLVIVEALGLLVFSAYFAYIKKNIYARFYFFSFSFLFSTLIFVFLSYFKVIDLSESTPYLFEIAILLEASGLSLSLSYKQKETALELKQKELLFKELSHRVQNNLQQIISILTLQKGESKGLEIKEYLEDTINRIGSISLIHKTLQNTSNLGQINMFTYLNSLVDGYKGLSSEVDFKVECNKELELDINILTSLALILNELITNSIKHAFKDVEKATISIKLEKNEGMHFTYEDNGLGFNKELVTNSIGSKLITILSKSQLKGKLEVDSIKRYFFSLEF